MNIKAYEFWFVTGSQHLYGPDVLQKVADHAQQISKALNVKLPFEIVFKPVVKISEEIRNVVIEANSSDNCAGIITWMHTFSPAKMWIAGLSELKKPLLHLHTQFNRDIPWDKIDMDFMNLNQSAHGDREFGFIGARMNIPRKVVVGYWDSPNVSERIEKWLYTAVSFSESKKLKVARFGDNMRNVAVTEGDKVEAQIKFGWTVDGYGIGDLVQRMNDISEAEVDLLLEEYENLYDIPHEGITTGPVRDSIREQARIELGLKAFLIEGGYSAFTTTFEDLHGMKQLPGLAAQRLMAEGYGFAGEGDWKTAAFVRLMKIIAAGKETSFMEDYTYHLDPENELVLGSHMLEICPTVASSKPKIVVHPLSIGGKEDPARLVFDGVSGHAVNATIIDLGNRFRLLINEVEAVVQKTEMPNLPIASVLWKPLPSLIEAAEAWIHAGGAHHTVFSTKVTTEQLIDWAEMIGIDYTVIDKDTNLSSFRKELKLQDITARLM